MKVFNDNTPDEVIFKVNLLLKKHGLWFEDDGQKHERYLQYELKTIHEPNCNCWSHVSHDPGCSKQ
jgi:hypothetical protein